MKPVILEMTAFGSYAKPTTVDFQKWNHSLYLIAGDTGAGKTTIFDAIMVALYGVASGKGDHKARTFEMMHCDYVEKSTDTRVALSFLHMGKLYRVERTLHFKKKRGTGEYEKTTPSAIFWEPDGQPLEKTEQVTERITKLLGMNAEQFRKIAMLAQGEFKKFLDADSEEKNKILGELFDSSAYVYFQDLFDAARKKLEQERREKGTEQIRRVMEDFLYPEDMGEEERAVLCAGHPALEETLCQLADRDGEEREALLQKEQEYGRQEKALHEKKGGAQERNRQLEELFQKEEAYNALQKKQAAMEALKEQVDKAERAFYKVKPKQAAAKKAAADYERALRETKETKERLEILVKDRENRKLAWEETGKKGEPLIAELAIRIDSLEKAIPRYEELEENRRGQQEQQRLVKEAAERRKFAEEKKNRLAQELRALKEGIKELEGADVRKERLAGSLDRARENLDKLISEQGLLAQTAAIRKKEECLQKEREILRETTCQAGQLEAAYHKLYQAFLSGQAGILAKNLEQELQEQGEAQCPVCKTAFQAGQVHSFAKGTEEIPEKSQVDEARRLFDEKDGERQEQSRKTAQLEAALGEEKAGVTARMRELAADCADWETLCREGYLEELENRYRQQEETAKEAFALAREQSKRLEALKEQAAEKETEEKDCAVAAEESREQEQAHRHAAEKKKAAAEALTKSLPCYEQCPDRESAARQRRIWEEEKKQWELRMEQALTVYTEADRKCEETGGILRAGTQALPKYAQEREEAAKIWREEMELAGFDSEEALQQALYPAGESDTAAQQWITAKRAQLTDYENALKNTKERITELRERTKGQEKTDLTKLDEDIKKQGERLEELQGKLRLCEKRYENHRLAAAAVKKANQALKDTEAAWIRLDDLANLANGSNAAGGRLSFDRYVMGYVFREVLEMANRRLAIMSGGRYELLHEMYARRGNAAAGLEVSVFDMTTGKSRPSQSLSGGESFFVSLALALGLSDVVQNHAGGRQLDALFIDEGFGTLDSDVLDRALAVLNRLTQGNRLVGIISHVARLEDSIPQQIRVKSGKNGSSIEIVQ